MPLPFMIKQLTGGFMQTILIFTLTLLFSFPLGLIVCGGRMSNWAPLRQFQLPDWLTDWRPVQLLCKLLISILRGTPLMLQLLVVFYGPYYLLGININPGYKFYALIIGFSINYAAYFAEIFRAGIQSIPIGQYEAAAVLGYSTVQTYSRIIMPQVIKRILPPITNEVITLVKDTSLAFVLAHTEMFTLAKQMAAAQTTILPLFLAGIYYFLFNGAVALVMARIETKLDYYR